MFLRIFKHLLPRGRAWLLTIEKTLRRFFEGLATVGADAKAYLDMVYLDLFPQTTSALAKWEKTWNLKNSGALTEQQRRDRLAAAWQALGGQDPLYIQTTLQAAGFPVYVHEWWDPGTVPMVGVKQCVAPRNPTALLFPTSAALQTFVECGEVFAACGEPAAEAGNNLTDRGYPLVNKILRTTSELSVLCGEDFAQCGEPVAEAGQRSDYANSPLIYVVPQEPEKWPYFLYIGAQNFPELAALPASRRNEFEELCLKICPTQQWLGIMVVYT